MGKVFCYNCFIEKYSSELIEKLKKIGYDPTFSVRNNMSIEKYIIINSSGSIQTVSQMPSRNNICELLIDCGKDEDLFLRLARKKKKLPVFKIKVKNKITDNFLIKKEYYPMVRKTNHMWSFIKIGPKGNKETVKLDSEEVANFFISLLQYYIQNFNRIFNVPTRKKGILSIFEKRYRIIAHTEIIPHFHSTDVTYKIKYMFYPEFKKAFFWHFFIAGPKSRDSYHEYVNFPSMVLAQDFINNFRANG